MTDTFLYHHAAIIGLGQMGTSVALAMQKSGLVGSVSGYDMNVDYAAQALAMEAVDAVATSCQEMVATADLIVFCTPISAYETIAASIAPYIREQCTVTDIGSIKEKASALLAPHVPIHATLIPSHPIAGSEKTGALHAKADFFSGKFFLITPSEQADEEAIACLARLWQSFGSKVEMMSAPLHDHIFAYMSHLPQWIAFCTAPVLLAHGGYLLDSETTYQRFIRIGRSDPSMWRDVFLYNEAPLLQAAASLKEAIAHVSAELLSGTKGQSASEIRAVKQSFPRILASSLVMVTQLAEQSLQQSLAPYAAGGFTDVSCPAKLAPEEDMAFISEHAGFVAQLLQSYLAQHHKLAQHIAAQNGASLLSFLSQAQQAGISLITTRH